LQPKPKEKPTEFNLHGETRVDPYYWLRERENPEVLEYLAAENRFTDETLAHVEGTRETLFEELKARIDPIDSSPPVRVDNFWYYSRFEDGADYPLVCRKNGSLEAEEEVLLDGPALAKGESFWDLASTKISWNEDLLAYATDTVGRRLFTIQFKNLTTGELLSDEIPNATGSMAWAADNQTLFYTTQDLETLRWDKVYRHRLGTDVAEDVLVYEEVDDTFNVTVGRSKSKKFLFLAAFHKERSEVLYLDSTEPEGAFQIFCPRGGTHEYSVDHAGDHFYIRTNHEAENFRLMSCPISDTRLDVWEDVIAPREDVLLEDFEVFAKYLVVAERERGLLQVRVQTWEGEEHRLEFDESTYYAGLSANPTFATETLRYAYSSMTTPFTIYDYEMGTRERTLVQRKRVLGDFDPTNYRTERLWAKAPDGVSVPISIVYRDGFVPDGESPLLLYGYGSYGSSTDATFSPNRLSLLDRGFAFAIAHIRGGEEMGRSWYNDGKKLEKMNTFTDFIACAEHLAAEGYTSPERMYAYGGSAGGLLLGAVVNLRPDLFHGMVAAVPFVDVLTTMLDESIPLTTSEYDEWGNPNDRTYYEYMRSYSPYDNVTAQAYPHMLITTGLHDSQVQYWEPAKWVAKLRDLSTSDNRLLLKTNMDAGHGGPSGRYQRYREVALDYAFLLDLAGKL